MGKEGSKIPVGISSCLTGKNVRYDGDQKRDLYVMDHLTGYFDLHPFCPEVEAGMGVPREPIQLVYKNKKIRALGVKNPDDDFTRPLKKITNKNTDKFRHLCGYLLKARSPSCGMAHVPLFKNKKLKGESTGIFAQKLMKHFPCLPVEESERLDDPTIRENFFQRVYVMHRWQQILKTRLTPKALQSFHEHHKYLMLSHRADSYQQLERMVKKAKKKNIKTTGKEYISLLMATLKIKASRKSHAVVMREFADQLAEVIKKSEQKELANAIDAFREEGSSITAVINLLRPHIHKLPDSQAREIYLEPYPKSLGTISEV